MSVMTPQPSPSPFTSPLRCPMILNAARARLRLPWVATPFLRIDATRAQASRSSSHVFISGVVSQRNERACGARSSCWSGSELTGAFSVCMGHLNGWENVNSLNHIAPEKNYYYLYGYSFLSYFYPNGS